MNANTAGKKVSHAAYLRKFLVGTWGRGTISHSVLLPVKLVPFNLESAFSIATWTSLFSPATHKSKFVKVDAFSSQRRFENVKTTTGSKFFFRGKPTI